MDKTTRSAIERATQKARHLLEDEFEAQLEGTFDILPNGSIAERGGPHLTPRQAFERDVLVAAIERKRAVGMKPADAVADYLRDAAFTLVNRFVALKMLEARGLVQQCVSRGPESSGYAEFAGMAPGLPLLPDERATASTSRACSTSSPPRSRCCSTAAIRRACCGPVDWRSSHSSRRSTAPSSTGSGPTTRRSAGSTSTSTAPTSARRCATRARRRGTAGSWPSATSSSRRATSSSS